LSQAYAAFSKVRSVSSGVFASTTAQCVASASLQIVALSS
jgi:hypothetical protein